MTISENKNQLYKMKDCTIRPKIEVGQKIPDEIRFSYDGGGGWTNMASNWMDMLFKKHLKALQEEEYVFSEICRNENEKKALELAIKENCEGLELNIVGYYNTDTQTVEVI